MPTLSIRIAELLAIVGLLLFSSSAAQSQSLWREDFEGPETRLIEAGSDAQYKIELHQRVAQAAHSGAGCERITLRGNNGSYLYMSLAIDPGRVITELVPSVWIKADRPGIQILARVVLPRAVDPKTGNPQVTLLRGAGYTQVGSWQQLRADGLPRLLEQQARVIRAELKSEVDTREAYVDRVVLNIYGGPGTTNVWVDDVEVAGIVPPQGAVAMTDPTVRGQTPAMHDLPQVWAAGRGVPKVELRGSILLVDGRPFCPRAIEHRGEPLSKLRSLGFNAVRLRQTPSPELLREAAASGVWLIAPPPPANELEKHAPDGAPKLPSTYDPVLVWDLGTGLASRELEATRRWAKLLASADARTRPIACGADAELKAFTRPPVNLFLAGREPLKTTLALTDYDAWLKERAKLVLAGTPLWAVIQTAPSERLVEQAGLLAATPRESLAFDEAQIRALARIALAAGARGLCFQNNSRLDLDDPASQRRAAVLELVNRELELIERWPASGTFAAAADSNDPHATGAVIETDRSRLLLPIFAPANSQFATAYLTAKPLVLRVSGVPEGNKAFELSPTALRPLTPKRVAGGTQVALAEAERDSLVLFTQDELVIRSTKALISQTGARAAQVARSVAAARLAEIEAVEMRLGEVGRAVPATRSLRTAAEADLQASAAAIDKQQWQPAYEKARRVLQAMRDIERMHWEQAAAGLDWPLANPLLAHINTLPDYYRMQLDLESASPGENRTPEGSFEDLSGMLRVGWRYYQYQQTALATSVELSPQSAYKGRTGLRLRAAPQDPQTKALVVENAPLWVTSASINVQQGDLVQIQLWLRVASPITGSVDGLLIMDSLSGEPLAQRVIECEEWTKYTIYRAVPQSGPMNVTFALSGIGEAEIDEVSIRVIPRGPALGQQAQRRMPRNSVP